MEGGDPFIAHLMSDAAINQFLSAAPAPPEKLERNSWPSIVLVSKLKKADQAPLKEANQKIMKAVELGKRIYEKARSDHASFTRIIKGGASALTLARRDKNSAERDLKKAKVAATDMQDSTILMLERDHANKKIVTLVDQQKRNKKTIEKLEKKIDDLKKELQKNKSTKQKTVADTVDAHRKKKEIDLEAYAPKKKVGQRMQKKKEDNNKKKKNQCFDDTETLYKHGGSFSSRLGNYLDNDSNASSSSSCSADDSVSYYRVLLINQFVII